MYSWKLNYTFSNGGLALLGWNYESGGIKFHGSTFSKFLCSKIKTIMTYKTFGKDIIHYGRKMNKRSNVDGLMVRVASTRFWILLLLGFILLMMIIWHMMYSNLIIYSCMRGHSYKARSYITFINHVMMMMMMILVTIPIMSHKYVVATNKNWANDDDSNDDIHYDE